MRILIFHGYLLSGTGSNVYNASLARAMRALGHEVHLLCQERSAAELDWVDAAGDWDTGELRVRATGAEPGAGSVTVYRPDIGGLLPVFVHDDYAGFEVRTFGELSDAEIERYIELNVTAVREVVERVGEPGAVLANHLVMAPVILGRAGLRYALKVHGSDLSYTVLPELDRFGPYAREAAAGATAILVGSGHIAERLRLAVNDPTVSAKVRLGPPGVDTELFAPVSSRAEGSERLLALANELRSDGGEEAAADAWSRDVDAAAGAVEWFAAAAGPRAVFVGKLIVSKGADLLLAAWPLVHAANPGARLLVVGFGGYREALERLWAALSSADVDGAREVARAGRALEGGPGTPLRHVSAVLADPPPGYADAATAAAGSVAFAGRLEHDEVAGVLPACDALVFPSSPPEAFGMVAAEAAAAGVLPVSAAHSGALEVSRALAAELPAEVAELVSFPVDDQAVSAIAQRLRAWFEIDEGVRAESREALRATSSGLWGWEGVARSVIAASEGRLGDLRPLPNN